MIRFTDGGHYLAAKGLKKHLSQRFHIGLKNLEALILIDSYWPKKQEGSEFNG